MDMVDDLRPPGLVYKTKLYTMQVFKSKCVANAISPSGQFVGWFSSDGYEIYELTAAKPSIVCTGKVKQRQYRYGRTTPERIHAVEHVVEETMSDISNLASSAKGKATGRTPKPTRRNVEEQMTSGFSCAALSDSHIAVGAKDTVLIFAIQGEVPGRWVCVANVKGAARIEKLAFSPNGGELVALFSLAKNDDGKNVQAIIYSTSEFTTDSDEKVKSLDGFIAATWKFSICEIPDAAFSSDGKRIAVATYHDNDGKSHVHLLSRRNSQKTWRNYGRPLELKVLNKKSSNSRGITGISLYTLS